MISVCLSDPQPIVQEGFKSVLEGCEECRARAHGDGDPSAVQTHPLIQALARSQAAVEDGQPIPEASAQTRHDLMGEGDLGNQYQGLSPRLEGLGHGPEVHLGLAAPRDTMEQELLVAAFANAGANGLGGLVLFWRKQRGMACLPVGAEHTARDGLEGHFDEAPARAFPKGCDRTSGGSGQLGCGYGLPWGQGAE